MIQEITRAADVTLSNEAAYAARQMSQQPAPEAARRTSQEPASGAVRQMSRQPAAQAAPSQASASELQGVSLADASATMSSGRNLIADYVIGADSHLSEIRLIDPTTHQVIAASPPDSIARMQQEVLAYQSVANQAKTS